MKEEHFERKNTFPSRALIRFALMPALFLLLIGCGASKKASEVSTDSVIDIIVSQETGTQLQDDCALLHIYRKSSMVGAAINYDLYLGNDKVFRASNKNKTTVRITQEGMNTLSAKTETKTELPVNIQLGKEYYVRCGLKMGALVGRPVIELMDSATGKTEFDKIPLKKK